MLNRLYIAVACFMTLLAGMVVTPGSGFSTSAFAAACGNTLDIGHIGMAQDIANTGAQANISYKEPTLCGGTGSQYSDISIWVMVSASPEYLQAGYTKEQGWTQSYMFSEWSPASGIDYLEVYYDTAPGTANYYKSGYDPASQQRFSGFSSDGSKWTHLHVLPKSYFDWTNPTRILYEAEIHDPGDAVPGRSTSPAVFSQIKYKNLAGNWVSPTGLQTVNTLQNGHSLMKTISPTSFQIWDTYNN